VIKILDALKWIFRGREITCALPLNLRTIYSKIDKELTKVKEVQMSLLEIAEILIEFAIRKTKDIEVEDISYELEMKKQPSSVDPGPLHTIVNETLNFLSEFGLAVVDKVKGTLYQNFEEGKMNVNYTMLFNSRIGTKMCGDKSILNYMHLISNAT